MEPLTPTGDQPFPLATGRLFHEDRSVVALMLERPRLLPAAGAARHALIVSNPGGGLPLLELFSRNTSQELRNGGYEVTTRFGRESTRGAVRRLLPQQDIFLWE